MTTLRKLDLLPSSSKKDLRPPGLWLPQTGGPTARVSVLPFTWRRKKIQLPERNFIEIQTINKTAFIDYNAPWSEPFRLHLPQFLLHNAIWKRSWAVKIQREVQASEHSACGRHQVPFRVGDLLHTAHPEEKWHNSKSTIFQEKQLFFLIRVFKIEESETANTYVGKKGIL
jgi:hypothetical protein